jgi:hypothetical protein
MGEYATPADEIGTKRLYSLVNILSWFSSLTKFWPILKLEHLFSGVSDIFECASKWALRHACVRVWGGLGVGVWKDSSKNLYCTLEQYYYYLSR